MSSQLQQRCREMAAAALQAPPKDVWVKAPPVWSVIKIVLALCFGTVFLAALAGLMLYPLRQGGVRFEHWPFVLFALLSVCALALALLAWTKFLQLAHAWLRKGFFLRADA